MLSGTPTLLPLGRYWRYAAGVDLAAFFVGLIYDDLERPDDSGRFGRAHENASNR
jgi:hypothetical protein